MRSLWTFFKRSLRYRRQLLAGFLCIPIANLADIGITVLIGNAINRLRDAEDTAFLPGLLVLFAIFALAHGVFRFLQRWWIVVVSRYFEVGLARALEVFNDAYRQVSGLARTVRGPSMSATPGKILVDGVVEISGESHFVLKLIQARRPEWVGRTFFARFDPGATWIDELMPPRGEERFFFDA